MAHGRKQAKQKKGGNDSAQCRKPFTKKDKDVLVYFGLDGGLVNFRAGRYEISQFTISPPILRVYDRAESRLYALPKRRKEFQIRSIGAMIVWKTRTRRKN